MGFSGLGSDIIRVGDGIDRKHGWLKVGVWLWCLEVKDWFLDRKMTTL